MQSSLGDKNYKTFIRKKHCAYESFVKIGQPAERNTEIHKMISLSSKMVEDAKHKYFSNIGATLAESSSNRKAYWSVNNTGLQSKCFWDKSSLMLVGLG